MGSKLKYTFLSGSVAFLVLLAMPCSGDLSINMIPEVFEVPNSKTKTFFGASVAIKSESVFVAAPYWESGTGVFKCAKGATNCAKGVISSGIGDASNKKIFDCAKFSDGRCSKADMRSNTEITGHFASKSSNDAVRSKLDVGRSPSDDPTGDVTISLGSPIHTEINIKGFQYGERFGHSLCAVDINNDGYDDLVVGAPYHSRNNQRGNTGAIYIFENPVLRKGGAVSSSDFKVSAVGGFEPSGGKIPDDTPQLTPGERFSDGARYGASVINIGHLNDDDYEDFAVGAPYEGGTGAVYLYLGSENFWTDGRLRDNYQKITPEGLKLPGLRGFGYSFSNAQLRSDDGNQMPYFAIGSVNDDYGLVGGLNPNALDKIVVLDFFCINLGCKSTVTVNPETIKKEEAFEVNIILPEYVTVKDGVTPKVLRVELSGDDRVINADNANDPVIPTVFTKGKPLSFKRKMDPTHANFESFESIEITAKLTWSSCQKSGCSTNEADGFEEILEEKTISIFTGCDLQPRANCRCDLTAEFYEDNYVDPLTVGDIVNPTAYIKVTNKGDEPAYDARLLIDSEVLLEHDDVKGCKSLSLVKKEGSSHQTYNCSLPPIQHGENATEVIINLEFDMSKVQNSAGVTTQLLQACKTVKDPIDYPHLINLEYKYNIVFEQSKDEYQEPINFEEDQNVQFSHTFEITNKGPSPTNKVLEFNLYVPTILVGKTKLTFHAEDLTVDPNTCTKKDIGGYSIFNPEGCTVDCTKYTCEIPKPDNSTGLKKQSSIFATLNMEFLADSNFFKGKSDEFEFETVFKVMEESASRKTRFRKRETKVGAVAFVTEFWPFIAGGVGAILLFGILMYAGYRFGFHQKLRFAKNKLEQSGG